MNELWLTAVFFLFVLSAISVTGYFVLGRREAAGERSSLSGAEIPIMASETSQGGGLGMVVRAFQLVGEAMPGAKSPENPLRAKLAAAGYRLPFAVAIFEGLKVAGAIAIAIMAGWIAVAVDANLLLPLICGLGFGFLLPERVLDRVVRARARRLRRSLPSALDMLTLAVEAGQSIDQAMLATCRGLKNTHPDLAAELTILQLEARAGNNRPDALRNFASRNKDKEIKKFAGLLIDTDRFGSSVGPALRDHAKYLRIRARQQAQEAARKVGVKLIFPVFFLIFPSVVLVTLGPAAIMIMTQMRSFLGN